MTIGKANKSAVAMASENSIRTRTEDINFAPTKDRYISSTFVISSDIRFAGIAFAKDVANHKP